MIGSYDTSTYPFSGKCECTCGESSVETGTHTGRPYYGADSIVRRICETVQSTTIIERY